MTPKKSPKKSRPIRFNTDKLIRIALTASPVYPRFWGKGTSHEGMPCSLPGMGGINYNILVGDPACGWAADHLEPCISLGLEDKRKKHIEKALNHLACIGNPVRIISGAAKGKTGWVTGHHGGAEHVIVDMPSASLKKITYKDDFLIESAGLGLDAIDFPDAVFYNIDPKLAAAIFKQTSRGRIAVPIRTRVGPELMGSGLGTMDSTSGDFDIQTSDKALAKKYGIDRLRLGDIVCLDNFAHHHGWCYRSGYVTFGVIIHGDSAFSGHGPGVSTICAGPKELFECTQSDRANIGVFLKCGRYRAS